MFGERTQVAAVDSDSPAARAAANACNACFFFFLIGLEVEEIGQTLGS